MELLENAVRPYAWGSRTVIAELLGEPVPSAHPQAELWFGAHPGDPSRIVHADGRRTSLLDAVRADPAWLLGAARAQRWDSRLPFLLKVLAADEPLSLQAHPSAVQAADGFARENAAGIPRDASERNYRDASHKPELICALTPFHALVGFREPAATVRLLQALAVPALAGHVELLSGQLDADGLRALFTTWITLPQSVLDTLVPALQDGCVRLAGHTDEFHAEARSVLELSERYPGDAGVLAALLLNRVTLAPGEALFLPAGNLHTYLSGAGIEVMANSDNVLRGGLTPKHVDVPELLRVLDFTAPPPPVLRGRPDGAWLCYDTPAEEFLLRRWQGPPEATGIPVPDGGPRILLCTDGVAWVRSPGADLELRRGASLWLAAADSCVTVHPRSAFTQLFLAGDGIRA
ncbi:MAG: mannose-6-phosphate isomerase, class I [Pseudonocardia sp.]